MMKNLSLNDNLLNTAPPSKIDAEQAAQIEHQRLKSKTKGVANNKSLHSLTATILIVANDANTHETLKFFLQAKYEILNAFNGNDALKEIDRHTPNLIITDIEMPVRGGLDLIKGLKQNAKTSGIPIIAISVNGREEAKVNGFDTEADAYLLKPFSKNELFAHIRSRLKIARVRNEADRNLRNILMQAPVAIMVLKGPDYKVELANDSYLQIVEKHAGFIGKPLFRSLPEFKTNGVKELLDSVMKSGLPYYRNEIEVYLPADKKKVRGFYNFVYQPMREEGIITGIMVVATEVTDLITAKRKIEESEIFSRKVLENSPDCVKVLDGEGRLQFMNSNGQCKMEIDNFAPFKNKLWFEMWGADNYELVKGAVTNALLGQKTHFQAFCPTAKGTPRWWDVIVQPIESSGEFENTPKILSISRDITDEKNNQLKESELLNRFQGLVAQAPVAISILRGKNYLIEIVNERMLEMWDRKTEEVINEPAFKVLAELKDQRFKKLLDNVYDKGERFVAEELPIKLTRNGKKENAFVKFIYEPLRDPDGSVSGVMALAHEITEQVILRKKIEESERRYHHMIYTSTSQILILRGVDLVIEVANNSMLKSLGKGSNIIGKPLLSVVPEIIEQGLAEILHQVYKTGHPSYGYEIPVYLVREGNKELSYFTYVYQAQKDTKGEINGIAVIANEVTPQAEFNKKIKESEEKFRLITELMPEKVTQADRSGNVIYYNKNWLDFTGVSLEEMQRAGWEKWIHTDQREEATERWRQSVNTGKDFKMELQILSSNGAFKWHLSHAVAVKDNLGTVMLWIGINTEIQQIKDEYNKKDDFVKMVSHELKTPVTAIKGYIQVLLMMLEGQEIIKNPLQVKNSLVRVDKLVSRLTRLITEMLDLTRIDENKLTLKNELFSLNDLIIETVEDLRYSNAQNPIIIFEDFSSVICGDRDRIGQVIINFIGNAIKYSPNNSAVEVRIRREGKDKAAVSVRDYGIGINKQDHQKIFERFFRVEGKEERTFSGFGIGLYIAKAIIDRHNGTIAVESEKGKGSIFTFILQTENKFEKK